MAFLLLLLFAFFASYKIKFGRKRCVNEIQRGNESYTIFRALKELSFPECGNIFESFYGGGGSGDDDDDEGATFFRPGRWNFFPDIGSHSLLHYDLQWQPEHNLMLFPKQLHEDEALVYAWNAIMGKENGISLSNKVSYMPVVEGCNIIFSSAKILN